VWVKEYGNTSFSSSMAENDNDDED